MINQLVILDEIAARLSSITTANGYSENVDLIERSRLEVFLSGDLPAINYWPVTDVVVAKEYGKEVHELTLVIELHTVTRDEPFTDVAFTKSADIITALFRSTTARLVSDSVSVSLGGLVDSILASDVTPVIGQGQKPWCGVILDVVVGYNTDLGDAFNIVNF